MGLTAAKTIDNLQQVVATLTPRLSDGSVGAFAAGSVPTWAVVSGDGTVVPAADGMSATLVSGTALADTVYTATCDPGGGAAPLVLVITLTVVTPGSVVGVDVAFGTPSLKAAG